MQSEDTTRAGANQEPVGREAPLKAAGRKASVGLGVLAAALLLGSIAVLRTQTVQLELVPGDAVPEGGNFLSIQRPEYPPLPFNPFPGLVEVYACSNTPGWYWLDDRAVDYQAIIEQWRREQALSQLQTRYGLTRANAEAVVELGGWVVDGLEAEAGAASLMSGYTLQPGDFCLEMGAVNSNANVTVRGTSSENLYSLLSISNVTATAWQMEQLFRGAAGQDWTDLTVPVLNRTNCLFFRGMLWSADDQPGNGLAVSITNPPDGAYFEHAPTNLTLQAAATATNGSILGVAFYEGANLLGLVTSAPYDFTWSNIGRGRYTVCARAYGSTGSVVTSPGVEISVDPCYPTLDVMLVLDRSGSMDSNNKFNNARQACSNFIGTLTFPADQAGLVSFSNDPTNHQTLTYSSGPLLLALSQVPDPSGYTYMSNALRTAKAELTSARHNTNAAPIMVFLSDGEPSDAPSGVLAAAQFAKTNQTRTRIFTVGIGSVNSNLMQQIASSPSDYFYTNDYSDMSPLFNAIAYALCRTNLAPVVSITWPTNWATFTAGSNLTLQATASDSDGSIDRVQFFNNEAYIGTAAQVGNAYQLAWSGAPVGTNMLTAVATDNNELTATSQSVPITVTHPGPSVAITNPTGGQRFVFSPTNIVIQATASAIGADITNVQFFCNGTNLGQATSSPYQVLWTNVLAGSNYTLTAVATDSLGAKATNDPPVVVSVNAMPTVWIAYPTNASATNLPSFTEHTNITLCTSAADSDGSITNVRLFHGTNLLGNAGPDGTNWSLVWSDLAAGTYAVSAVATDNSGASRASDLRVFRVDSTSRPPSVWIVWPTNNATFRAGANITLLADASAVSPAVVTNVQFFANSHLLGSDPISPYSLTECCWKPGEYELRAVAVDDQGQQGFSERVRIKVADAVPTCGEGYWDPVLPRDTYDRLAGEVEDLADNYYAIAALQAEGTNLYLGMSYDWAGGASVYRSDGTNFEAVGDLEHLEVKAMALAGGCLYAGGDPGQGQGIMHKWDGTNWTQMGSSIQGEVWAVAAVNGELYIGGDFAPAEGSDTNLQYFARWDPALGEWEPVSQKLNGAVRAIAGMGGQIYIGGDFTGAGESTNLHHIARLEEGQWVALGSGVGGTNSFGPPGEAYGYEGSVYCLTPCGDRLFVGGDFTSAGEQLEANGIAIWQSNRWSTVGRGLAESDFYLRWWDYDWTLAYAKRLVRSIAVRGNDIFVTGRFRGPMTDGTNSLVSCHAAKATWSESNQAWSWSDLDRGLEAALNGNGIEGAGLATAILEGLEPMTYSVIVGGQFQYAGSTFFYPPDDGWTGGRCIGRWNVNMPRAGAAPEVRLTSPSPGAVFTNTSPGFAIELLATASSGTNITRLDLLADGDWLTPAAWASNNVYVAAWNNPPVGVHTLKATASADDGLTGESGCVVIAVKGTNGQVVAVEDCYSFAESSPRVSLPVLTNDLPQDGSLRISRVVSLRENLGRVSVAHDGKTLLYQPLERAFGSDRLFYAVTNAAGDSDSAWVTVHIRSWPVVAIGQPWEGDRLGVSSNLSISGYSLSYDHERPVTNVTLFINGEYYAQTTNTAFGFSWSTNATGFYTLSAVATDNEGITNHSALVTVAVTNTATATNTLTATIENLPATPTALGTTTYTVVRNGLFGLQGQARDSNPNDPVAYQVLLLRPEDNQDPDATRAPFANVTPGPLDTAGFHSGGDISNSLGTLDLTAIPNGTYDLMLIVHGGGGETNTTARFNLDTQLKLGQFSFSEQDLIIPVNGIPLTVTRTYNSLNPRSADFGYSWSHSLMGMDVALDDERQDVTVGGNDAPWADEDEDENGLPKVVSIRTGGGWDVTLTLPEGRRTTFAFKPTFSPSECKAYAHWEAPPDVHATLKPLGTGEGIIYLLPLTPPYWHSGGANSTFPNHDIAGWVLETQDGTKYNITRGSANNVTWQDDPLGNPGHYINVAAYGPPRLTSIVQRSGDRIEINSAGIQRYNPTNGLTRAVWIERDVAGRIVAIRDPNSGSSGRPVLEYVYNRDTGNLIQVRRLTDRAAGTFVVTKYHYDHPNFPHYITSTENPLGVPVARNEYDDAGRFTAVVDANGCRTEFHHSTSNSTEVVIDRLGHTNIFAYDLRGNVTATTNALGGITTMGYDDANNKTREVAYLGGQPYATNRWAYTDEGFLLWHTDPLQQTVSFVYNRYGQVTNSVDARGYGTTNYYDSAGNLAGTVDELNHSTTNVYNDRGLLAWSRDAVGTVTTNSYDELGNLTGSAVLAGSGGSILSTNSFEHDANGNRTVEVVWRRVNDQWQGATNRHVFDAQNRVVQTIDALGYTNTVVYNEIGKPAQTIDKLGRLTSYEYDGQGRLFRTTYPDLHTEISGYDASGNRTSSVDRGSHTTGFVFDALNRVVQTVFADGTTNRMVFDDLGRVRFSVDAKGVTNAFSYDVAGRRTTLTNALGTAQQAVYRYGFDENGNQVWSLAPSGAGTTNVFDELNRLVEVRFANGTHELTGFDAAGRRIAEINEDTVTNLFGFDGAGRLTSVTNALGTTDEMVTRYQYDEVGNQTTQIDALLRTNRFGYDLLGSRVWHLMPDGTKVERFAYDGAGNLTLHTNFNGIVITNQYDLMNRLTNVSSVNGYNLAFTYTPTGQRETMSDPSGATGYYYDSRDRLTNKEVAWPGGLVVSLSYAYDLNGNVTNIWSSTTGGVNLRYDYDPLNRITNVLANGTACASYGFDLNGNLQSIRHGNGVTNLCQYDLLNRLTSSVWKSNQLTLASFYYQLGAAGKRTNLTETLLTGVTNRTYAWSYDKLYRLTGESISGLGSNSYVLDRVGNRTSRSTGLDSLPAQSFSYGTNDWLASDAYDSNGNTLWSTNGGTAAGPYYYDVENRLTNFNDSVFLAYNGEDIRVEKSAAGTNYFYLVDDRNPSGYAQMLEEWTASGGGGTTNRSHVYNWGLGLLSQREPGGTVYYLVPDGHGSTRLLTDGNGSIVNAFSYDAYGNLIASNGPPQTCFLYCGEQFDPHLGSYYQRARYYKPDAGRFWTMDTYEGNGQDSLSLHKYLYCHADPVNGRDPSGHELNATGQLGVTGIIGLVARQTLTTVARGVARANWNLTRVVLNQDKIWFYMEATAAGAAGLGFLGGIADDMAAKLLRNSEAISANDFERGRQIERIAGANLNGNVEAIDDLRPGGVATQVKSIGLESGMDLDKRIANTIRDYAREMDGIEERELRGTASDGRRIVIRPGTIQHKVLTVAIPENHGMVVQSRWVRQALENYRSTYRVYIQLVPVRGWRK